MLHQLDQRRVTDPDDKIDPQQQIRHQKQLRGRQTFSNACRSNIMKINRHRLKFVMGIITLLFILGCMTSKKMSTAAIPAVQQLDLNRYAGTWYEIARLPHSFEKNLQQVTATYTLRDDGKVTVLNRGYDTKKDKWREARGKAWVPDLSQPGVLKVSFFWFFGATYKVIALDDVDYSYALVTSSSKNYLWILGRTPQMEPAVYDSLLEKARKFGFDLTQLEPVQQL